VLAIPSLNITLALVDVYDKVTLPTQEQTLTSEDTPTEGSNV
jgi:hypothetical protein